MPVMLYETPVKEKGAMFWDDKYESEGSVWGEDPGELAIAAVGYLQKYRAPSETLSILDIGCGYGRDAFYFSDNLNCRILGIDTSKKAIAIATNTAFKTKREDVRFQCCNFTELKEGKHDVVFISNLYQLLKKNGRKELEQMVMRTLRPKGLLFLSTLSVIDPEHFGKGIPSPEKPNSFQDKTYLHLCTREELAENFAFLVIKELYEHEYYEPQSTGKPHHHISWILIGEYIGSC